MIRRATHRGTGQAAADRHHLVALTASAIKGDEDDCLAAGMDAYITKPVTVAALGAVLDRVIDRTHGLPVVTDV
ncbi:MAG: hypothetical protein H0V52_00445 [Acidimicrobiia bacterium]|nr:hypothetical protein [Acidimicrobiia bacterium]